MRYFLLLAPLFLVIFSGCSSKQYFEPEKVEGDVQVTGFIQDHLRSASRDGAMLENNFFITKDGVSSFPLEDGYKYLNESKNYLFATNNCGVLHIYSKDGEIVQSIEYDREVLNAAEENDFIATINAGNEITLYDLKSKEFVFKQSEQEAVANDVKIAAPHFLNDIVIFPTLDGKMVIVDILSGKPVRNIAVSSSKFFNNIIFLNIVDDRLVAATQTRAVSVSPEFINTIELSLRDVIFVGDKIYFFTKEGEIVLTDSDLREIKRHKFPFAHFDAAIYGEFVYAIESQGYIIAVDRDLLTSYVYELDTSIDGPVFAAEDRVYFRDYYFQLSQE